MLEAPRRVCRGALCILLGRCGGLGLRVCSSQQLEGGQFRYHLLLLRIIRDSRMRAFHFSDAKETFIPAHFAFRLAGVADYALGLAVHDSWRGDSFVITFFC